WRAVSSLLPDMIFSFSVVASCGWNPSRFYRGGWYSAFPSGSIILERASQSGKQPADIGVVDHRKIR
ncbi:MAG TPA: hypothetical protein PK395_06665, partial [bacterium]|nr:hypothetical protein [bacterium]